MRPGDTAPTGVAASDAAASRLDSPASPGAGRTESDDGGADSSASREEGPGVDGPGGSEESDEQRGLGWLLKMSGLGAETTDPPGEAEPVSPAPVVAPVEEPEDEAEEEERPTWFEPNTDARMERPASLADKSFPPERGESADDDEGDADEAASSVAAGAGEKAADKPVGAEAEAANQPGSTEAHAANQPGSTEAHAANQPGSTEAHAANQPGSTEGTAAEAEAADGPVGAEGDENAPDGGAADAGLGEEAAGSKADSEVAEVAEEAETPTTQADEDQAEGTVAGAAEKADADGVETAAAADGGGTEAEADGDEAAAEAEADRDGDGTEAEAAEKAEADGGGAEGAVAGAGERLAAAVIGAGAPGVTTGSTRSVGQSANDPRSRLVDPEQVLSAYPFRFKPSTLREVADHPDQLRAVRDRLTDKLEYAERDAIRARLLSLRAVVSRVLGDLDFALADGRAALTHAERTGELRRTAIVQARLANVLRWRGDYTEADRLFEDANSPELPDRLRAEILDLAGRSAFEQDRYMEAMSRFDEALKLRRGDDPDRTELALDLVMDKIRQHGWGPYQRTPDEILGKPSPEPLEVGETWAEVQRYEDGLAWAKRHGSRTWELVDADGKSVLGGYVQVRPFHEGLAWVSRDVRGGWFAIDVRNRLVVPGGFEDVLPFRNGVAAVKAGGWGAVDRYARPVVQPRYRRFATVLTGGRRVDGFTREGLAIVDAGDRLGVIDRNGQLVVAPVHPALVIHPVAFLIADRNGRWGALDREGEPLIETVHRTEADVVDEIDQLLADTKPVL
ncbi:WG repeat-containing protein [Actinoplanes sp. NPDC049265]|uniref:WG repeat-containing protein n=1 Tax=Actinoplanes sp. NPDC049265 TaxID=3363902 RepID=UPI0037193B79